MTVCALDGALTEMERDGTLQAFQERWLGTGPLRERDNL
jgi:hypothetical protein